MTLTIGQLAEQTGFTASALRYYEEIGLIPAPPRASGRRAYPDDAADRLHVIALARSLDFPLDEVRDLLDGFPDATPASDRWRTANRSRIETLEAQRASIDRMLALLHHLSEDCDCPDLPTCARAWTERQQLG